MHNVDALSDQHVTQQWNVTDHCRNDALIVTSFDWKIVDFETVGHVPNAFPIVIQMGDDDNLMNNSYIVDSVSKPKKKHLTHLPYVLC